MVLDTTSVICSNKEAPKGASSILATTKPDRHIAANDTCPKSKTDKAVSMVVRKSARDGDAKHKIDGNKDIDTRRSSTSSALRPLTPSAALSHNLIVLLGSKDDPK